LAAKFKFTKFEQAQRPSGKNPNLTELNSFANLTFALKLPATFLRFGFKFYQT